MSRDTMSRVVTRKCFRHSVVSMELQPYTVTGPSMAAPCELSQVQCVQPVFTLPSPPEQVRIQIPLLLAQFAAVDIAK